MKTTPAVSSAMRSRSNSSLASHVLAALAAAGLASSAQAAQITWQGNVSGNMSDAANWVGGVAPATNVDAIRLGASGTAGTALIQNSGLQYTGNLTLGIPAIFFDADAPAYTISGNGSILVGSGSIASNSTYTQTINNNLRRNTSNPITIGANGGAIILNGNWDTSNGTTFAGFGTTNGGLIALNGNFNNSIGSITGLTINTSPGGSGQVVLSGNNSALTGNITLGSALLKVNGSSGLGTGAAINQAGGSTAAVWLASDSSINATAFSLSGPNTAGSSMRLVLDRATPGAAYDQSISIPNFGQQTNLIVQKGARVTSGTANLTITGNSTFGVATGTKVTLFSVRDVNANLGNVSAATSTAAVTSALVLDGSTSGSKVTGAIANTPGSFLHTVSLGKAGSGTWSLSGNNTYTGITAVNGGTLNLDFPSASTDTNILYNAGSPAVVTLGGGTLKLTGKTDTANSQSIASLAFTGGTESKISLVAGSGNATLALTTTGNFTVNTGSVVDFNLGAGTSVRNTAYTAAATFISGGTTIGGTEFARYDATGTIVAPVSGNYLTITSNTTGGSTSGYYAQSGGLARSTGTDWQFKGIKLSNTGSDDSLDLGGGNFTFSNSGILYTGGGNGNYTITNGSLRTTTSSTSLILNVVNSARLNISSNAGLDNNPNGTSLSEVIKAGEGTLVVSGNKSFTGKTRVLNGVYSFDSLGNGASPSGLGASSNVNTNLVLSGGVLRYTGPAATTDRGFSIGSNGATIDASGTGALTWAPAVALVYTNNTNTGTGTTFSQNQFITFAGSSTDANTFGSSLGLLADPNAGGQLSVTKAGNGTWVLSGNNTYTGATNINGGNLTLGFANFPGFAGPVGKFGDIVFGGGTLVFTAINTADYSSRIRNSAAAIKLNTNGQNVTFAQRVDETNIGGLTKLGAGTLTLSGVNSYTGVTTIEAGTLALSGSLASSVSLNSGANLQFTLGAASVPVATTTGNLTLAGNSTVTVVGTPAPDTTYTLLSANGVTGTPVLSSPIAGFSLVAESGSLKLKPASAADTTAPAAPSVALLAASDTGSSGTDLITKLTTPTLRVTLAGSGDTAPVAGDIVKLYAGATEVASATLVAGDITAGYVDLTTSALTAGVISFTATVTDAANNVSSASAALVVTLDTSSPVITLNGSASLTSDWGTAYSDAGATASDNVDASVTVVTVNPVVSSTPGVYAVTYNATDVAGNNAAQVTRSVTVSIANASTPGADGLSPLLKYAFGATSPSDTVQAPVTSATATELKLTAVVRTNDANLTVTAETNTDLATPASWTVTGVTESLAADQTNLPAGCVRKVYSVSITGASKKFLRIKAASTF